MTDQTIVEAAPQPSNFTANFTIRVTGLRTATINGIADAVKQVEWVLVGTEASQSFELPQTTQVPDPQSEGFIPLQNLTEAQVVSWIETHETRLPGIKSHIQLVLDREVAEAALQPTAMPWAPAPEVPETEAPPA